MKKTTSISPRMDVLLRDAAADYQDGKTPLSREWLQERQVTADECDALILNLASAIRVYLEVMRMGLKPRTPAETSLSASIIAASGIINE